MNKELIERLLAEHHDLFPRAAAPAAVPSDDATPTCGDGWYGLLDALSKSIRQQALALGLTPESKAWPRYEQIKQKFGELRISLSPEQEPYIALLDKYRGLSRLICEQCGEPGVLDCIRGNYKVRCSKHRPASDIPPAQPPVWRQLDPEN